MIGSRDGVYSIGGTPCRQIVDHAVTRGWAKRGIMGLVGGIVKEAKHEAVNVPPAAIPNETQLERAARLAGMSVGELVEQRMRVRERMEGK